jgi:hypothetical protein
MSINVLITDDILDHRNWIKASLVDGIYNGSLQEKVALAEKIFNISSFSNVGEAIIKIKNGYRPHLAIIDSDYQNLKDSTIAKKGLDPAIEKTATRGFDLLKALKDYAPGSINVIFTGKAGTEYALHEQLKKSGLEFGKDWILKGDKVFGPTVLAANMPYLLKRASWNMVRSLSEPKLNYFIEFVSGMKDNTMLLNYKLMLDEQTGIFLQNLLVGWASNVSSTEPFRIHFDNLRLSVSELFTTTSEYGTELNGIWKKLFMKRALLDYKSSPSYYSNKDQIDKRAAEIVIDLFRQLADKPKAEDFTCPFDLATEGYNCVNDEDQTFANPDFATKILNSLVCRRVILGLFKIRDNKTVPFNWADIFEIVCQILGRNQHSKGTKAQLINIILGLSMKNGKNMQTVKNSPPNILEEEDFWLKQFVPILENKVRNKNWSSFYET